MTLDDQTLMAYLDAELQEHEYEAVEQALAGDAALRERLQQLAVSSELLRQAFEPKLHEPVPPALVQAIWNMPLPATESAHASVAAPAAVPSPAPAPAPEPLRWLHGLLASLNTAPAAWATACAMLMAALLLQRLGPVGDADGPLTLVQAPDAALQVALETAPSGRIVQLPALRRQIELHASFARADGGYCREYSLAGEATGPQQGIACRQGDGPWETAVAIHSGGAAGGYGTASDAAHQALDDYLQAHGLDVPLDDAAEAQLLRNAWHAAPR